MSKDTVLLQTSKLQTGYWSGGRKVVVPAVLPDLALRPGQLVCLLGPNGAGKSTLLRTLAGLQPVLSGSITVEGIRNFTSSELARKISLVLTDKVRVSNLTGYELVSLGRYPYSGWLGGL